MIFGAVEGPSDLGRARISYNYLRLIATLPAIWLLLSVLVSSIYRGGPFDSISDYYAGSIRDVFVGGLMSCGICMIAYRGYSRLEDRALNFAGLNAFLVALIANSFQKLLDDTRGVEGSVDPPRLPSGELLFSLRATIVLLALVAIAFLVYDRWILKTPHYPRDDETGLAKVFVTISVVGELILVVLVFWLLFADTFQGHSIFTIVHFLAASLLIGNLSFAAATHAIKRLHKEGRSPMDRMRLTDEQKRKRLHYFRGVSGAMWVGLVVGGLCIWTKQPYAIIATEVWEIIFFVAYWLRATRIELGVPTPLLLR